MGCSQTDISILTVKFAQGDEKGWLPVMCMLRSNWSGTSCTPNNAPMAKELVSVLSTKPLVVGAVIEVSDTFITQPSMMIQS